MILFWSKHLPFAGPLHRLHLKAKRHSSGSQNTAQACLREMQCKDAMPLGQSFGCWPKQVSE
jgi:hypothetical protein